MATGVSFAHIFPRECRRVFAMQKGASPVPLSRLDISDAWWMPTSVLRNRNLRAERRRPLFHTDLSRFPIDCSRTRNKETFMKVWGTLSNCIPFSVTRFLLLTPLCRIKHRIARENYAIKIPADFCKNFTSTISSFSFHNSEQWKSSKLGIPDLLG